MSKYYILGAFLTLATWSGAYAPDTTSSAGHFQVGSAAQAGVRWTPNPERGSASSTLSGGRRSAAASACALDSELLPDPAVTLLVPNGETGLTISPQPTLSWYLESKGLTDMEFVLSHPEQAAPVYTKRLSADTGLVEVTLPNAVALEEGVRYRWTVFVTCNGGENEIHARSFVERVAASGLSSDVMSLSATEQAEVYAANGIWYDALNTLVNAYRSESQMSTLLDIRDLLEQAQTDVPLELSLATSSQHAVN